MRELTNGLLAMNALEDPRAPFDPAAVKSELSNRGR